jgi:integrase
MDGLVSHMLRKTVASFLDDSHVPARKISDQLGHSNIRMTQDRYLGRRSTDRQTAEVLEHLLDNDKNIPKPSRDLDEPGASGS